MIMVQEQEACRGLEANIAAKQKDFTSGMNSLKAFIANLIEARAQEQLRSVHQHVACAAEDVGGE